MPELAELKGQFKGWQAIVVIAVIIVVIVIRFISLSDMRNDKDLMKHIDALLMNEYAPHVAEELRDAVETGDNDEEGNSVKSILSTKVNIVSVKASYPFFDFSTPKEVVIKVVFSLDADNKSGEERTIYYLFKKGVFGWQYQYITTSSNYYLNFT
jgi:hypothetical protein